MDYEELVNKLKLNAMDDKASFKKQVKGLIIKDLNLIDDVKFPVGFKVDISNLYCKLADKDKEVIGRTVLTELGFHNSEVIFLHDSGYYSEGDYLSVLIRENT